MLGVLAALSFAATLVTATTAGAGFYLSTRTDVTTDLPVLELIGPSTVRRVWNDPELLATGLSYSLPMLFILLCHELGHYLVCRRYRLPATPPIFLPAPLALGTFGAFIRIRGPIRDRRQLLDVGAGGPLAGFAALLPFLVYGIARSRPALVNPATTADLVGQQVLVLVRPGDSLLIRLLGTIFHGPLPDSMVLDLHPFALAAWVGLFATALNLLPIGQLDGGHILYAAVGRLQRRLAVGVWVALGLVGLLWPGWFVWCLLLLLLGLRHPPVARPGGIDRRRMAVAALSLLLLILSFIPVPLSFLAVADETVGPMLRAEVVSATPAGR